MHDLRFVGVDEDGWHLLFADGEETRYRAPLDEPLRAAARRGRRARQGRTAVVTETLRAKDVQSLIRSGLSADEVAERAGWPVEKVHRFEGPILAEREHVAGLARRVRLRPRGGGQGASATLEARVTDRMRSREIEPATATWDSFRTPTGRWSVVVLFSAGGRERQAVWEFDPLARTVAATDDEARWLSEDEAEPAPGPIPAPHLPSHDRPTSVYDVEAEGGVGATPRRRRAEPVDLMAAMRERTSVRGRRRRSAASQAPGLDHVPDEALPLENLDMSLAEAGEPPAAHPRPADDPGAHAASSNEPAESGPASSDDLAEQDRVAVDAATPDEAHAEPAESAETDADDEAESDAHDETEHAADAEGDAAPPPDSGDPVDGAEPSEPPAGASKRAGRGRAASGRKSGRPSVPTWNDIMFGRTTD